MSLSLSDIQLYPKAELHRHIDGAVPGDALRRMLLSRGVRSIRLRTGRVVSVENEKEFFEEYRVDNKKNIEDFLAVFDIALDTVMQDSDGISEAMYEAICECARENILYVEFTCALAYHTRRGLSYGEALDAFIRGIARGRSDTGVVAKLICGIQREAHAQEKPEDKKDPFGIELVNMVRMYHAMHPEVAAIGLVCNEFFHAPEIYERAFAMTFDSSLGRTIHAGEMGTEDQKKKNIHVAIEKLRAHRIGHGIPVGSSEELLNQCARMNVAIESNPWSNMLLGFIQSVQALRVDTMFERAVAVSINSDDPILLRKSLSENLHLVLNAYGWGEEELIQLTHNALNVSFSTPRERQALYKKFGRREGAR